MVFNSFSLWRWQVTTPNNLGPGALVQAILQDNYGQRFRLIVIDPTFQCALTIMLDPLSFQRGVDAETRYDLPFLAGFAPDIAADPQLTAYFHGHDRRKQALGVALMVYLEQCGWTKQGRKTRVGGPGGRLFKFSERYQRIRR
jgi:hypothetical protein